MANAADHLPLQGLDRALTVLELLGDHPEGLTVSQLAARLHVDRANVYRVVQTLEGHRLLARHADGRLRLSVGLVELARRAAPAWWAFAESELEPLASELRATAILTVAQGAWAVVLLVAEPRSEPMHVRVPIGTRHPLSTGVGGRAILAGRAARPGEDAEITCARGRGWISAPPRNAPRALGLAAPIMVDGWADASVGIASLNHLDRRSVVRLLEAAGAIAAARPLEPDEPGLSVR